MSTTMVSEAMLEVEVAHCETEPPGEYYELVLPTEVRLKVPDAVLECKEDRKVWRYGNWVTVVVVPVEVQDPLADRGRRLRIVVPAHGGNAAGADPHWRALVDLIGSDPLYVIYRDGRPARTWLPSSLLAGLEARIRDNIAAAYR